MLHCIPMVKFVYCLGKRDKLGTRKAVMYIYIFYRCVSEGASLGNKDSQDNGMKLVLVNIWASTFLFPSKILHQSYPTLLLC